MFSLYFWNSNNTLWGTMKTQNHSPTSVFRYA
jgi:hypothetical protein